MHSLHVATCPTESESGTVRVAGLKLELRTAWACGILYRGMERHTVRVPRPARPGGGIKLPSSDPPPPRAPGCQWAAGTLARTAQASLRLGSPECAPLASMSVRAPGDSDAGADPAIASGRQ